METIVSKSEEKIFEHKQSEESNACGTEVINSNVAIGGKVDAPSGSHVPETNRRIGEKRERYLSPFLNVLLEGVGKPFNTEASMDFLPEWSDEKKLRRGRAFAIEHIFAVVYSEMLSLAILLSLRGSLEPLIFTGKSSTPFTSYQRYLSTVLKVSSWYESDPWDKESEARRHMSEVRAMHASVASRINGMPKSEVLSAVTLEGKKLWSTAIEDVRKDLSESGVKEAEEGCPFASVSSLRRPRSPSEAEEDGIVYFNQLDLSLTQFGFMGLIVLYPRKFGLSESKEEDLEAFVHLWRSLGYTLGTEDRYNFCSGDLEETRRRCRDLIEFWIKPNLLDVTDEWEHMYRCIVEGISYYVPANSFKASLAYLFEILEIPAPRLYSSMGWREKILLFFQRLVFRFILRIPGMFSYYNRMVILALKKARNASPEYIRKLSEKRYINIWKKTNVDAC